MGRFSLFLQTVTLFEAVDTAAAVHKLLFAREKRMALAADFNAQLFLGRAGRKGLAASAANRRFAVLGMDILLHACSTPLKNTAIGHYNDRALKKQPFF